MTPRRMAEDGLPRELAVWLSSARFRFAKTMPENPHWYVTERDEGRRGFGAELQAFVGHIRAHGRTRLFKGYPYTTITVDDHDYWLTRGDDGGAIVNRKPSPEAGWDDMTGWTLGAD